MYNDSFLFHKTIPQMKKKYNKKLYISFFRTCLFNNFNFIKNFNFLQTWQFFYLLLNFAAKIIAMGRIIAEAAKRIIPLKKPLEPPWDGG